MLLHVFPSQGRAFTLGLVKSHPLSAGGTIRLGMTLATQAALSQCNSPPAVQTPAGTDRQTMEQTDRPQHTQTNPSTDRLWGRLTHRFSPYTSAGNRGPQAPARWGRSWEASILVWALVLFVHRLLWQGQGTGWHLPVLALPAPTAPVWCLCCPVCVSDSCGCVPMFPGALCLEIWGGTSQSKKRVELAVPMLNKNTG